MACDRPVNGPRVAFVIFWDHFELAFWELLGVPGMFLSVPIMVMMLVICSHVPGLRKVAVLLSREGLPEDERELDRFNDEIEDRKAL